MNARAEPGWARHIAGVLAVPVALYLLAAGLLLFDLGSRPSFTYNWENNTLKGLYRFVEDPSLAPFQIKEGLMTDSGWSPWVVLPDWISFGLSGPSLLSLRTPVALVAAFAVPLLYLVGRRTKDAILWEPEGSRRRTEEGHNDHFKGISYSAFGVRRFFVPVVSAVLLALSPAYLIYARTGTVVGVSLVPALLTVLALFSVLERPDLWWRTAALLGALMLGAYGYAPVRFLWPICVGLLLLEVAVNWKDRTRRRSRLAASALLLVVAMPAFITALDFDHEHDLITSAGYYYAGRGEQIANLIVNVDDFNQVAGPGTLIDPPSVEELVWEVISKNVADMTNLFLDRDTKPALTDYWNQHGRLIPWWMMPLLVVGFLRAGRIGLRRRAYHWRACVLIFLGFTLPMLLTSQVHIGRLIFAVPFICLLSAFGLMSIADAIARGVFFLFRRKSSEIALSGGPLSFVLQSSSVVLLFVAVAWSTWQDYTVDVPLSYEAIVTKLLKAHIIEVKERGGGLALVTGTDAGLTLEEINSNQYKLMLHDFYHFYNLATGEVEVRRPGDRRPALYIGGLMDRLKDPESMPDYCKNIYYVSPGLMNDFQELANTHKDLCAEPVVFRKLP